MKKILHYFARVAILWVIKLVFEEPIIFIMSNKKTLII